MEPAYCSSWKVRLLSIGLSTTISLQPFYRPNSDSKLIYYSKPVLADRKDSIWGVRSRRRQWRTRQTSKDVRKPRDGVQVCSS